MKKYLITLFLLTVSGCGLPVSRIIDPLPNTGKGFWRDVAGTANAMEAYHDAHIYQNEAQDVPRAMNLIEERVGWLDRMKARLKRLQGTPIE